jgi:hypothetical protein
MAFLGEEGLLHDHWTIRFPRNVNQVRRVTLAIENNGDAIAVWWQASFDLPLSLLTQIKQGDGDFKVRERQVLMMMDTVGDVERRVVQNIGKLALFPVPPVQIAIISAFLDPRVQHNFDKEYYIDFELLTDRSKPVRNRNPIKIEMMPE